MEYLRARLARGMKYEGVEMRLFRRNKDAELWPDAELRVQFPDGTIRVDKNPEIVGGLLVSGKFEMAFRLSKPTQFYEWRKGKEFGHQPKSTGKYGWFMHGDESEEPDDEELQTALEQIYVRARTEAMEHEIRKRQLVWLVSASTLVATMLTAWVKFGKEVYGWWW